MELEVLQVAKLVRKSEGYVRQHINRGHLQAGRNQDGKVVVPIDEVLRWAGSRKLEVDRTAIQSLEGPALIVAGAGVANREARLSCLLVNEDGAWVNLCTSVRHRNGAGKCELEWQTTVVDRDVVLVTASMGLDAALKLVREMWKGRVELAGHAAVYDLEREVRSNLWRDHSSSRSALAPFGSPFVRHSADLTELWSGGLPREDRIRKATSLSNEALSKKLGLDIKTASDRIGNVLVMGALDEVACDVRLNGTGFLEFCIEPVSGFSPGEYRVCLWAASFENEVFRREVAVTEPESAFAVPAGVNRIGFDLYRSSDGTCLDRTDAHLVQHIGISTVVQGPQIHVVDSSGATIHKVDSGARSGTSVEVGNDGDQRIRRRKLEAMRMREEYKVRADGSLYRFGPGDFRDAVSRFCEIVRAMASESDRIYVVDRYLLDLSLADVETFRMVLDILAARNDCPLKMLCTSEIPVLPKGWHNVPHQLLNNVEIKSVRKRKADGSTEPAFHDRCLASRSREFLFTHSLNGWKGGGVTFNRLSYNVYFSEAEFFWSLDPSDTDFLVHDYIPRLR